MLSIISVLPEPTSPAIPKISPRLTVKDTSLKNLSFDKFLTSRKESPISQGVF